MTIKAGVMMTVTNSANPVNNGVYIVSSVGEDTEYSLHPQGKVVFKSLKECIEYWYARLPKNQDLPHKVPVYEFFKGTRKRGMVLSRWQYRRLLGVSETK